MKRKPGIKKIKKWIENGFRMPVFVWCMIVGGLMLFGVSFAWFTRVDRSAESKTTSVMAPYYLTLLNPSETDVLQLSIGNLMPGKTKQIIFCVSNKNNEENDMINMGGADFDYSMELIHTDNLALDYTLYELKEAQEGNADITAEDMVIVDGVQQTQLSYWDIGTEFMGTDVSMQRHAQLGLTGDEINSGTYITYAKNDNNDFHLSDNGSGYDSQYFLMELEWQADAVSNFEQYDKETDMIYVLVKAVLPKPE